MSFVVTGHYLHYRCSRSTSLPIHTKGEMAK